MAKYRVDARVTFKISADSFSNARNVVIEILDDRLDDDTGFVGRIVTDIHMKYPEAEG